MVIFGLGLIGVLCQNAASYFLPICRSFVCTVLQETFLAIYETIYCLLYIWLLTVTFNRASSVNKVLNEEKDPEELKNDSN